MNNLPVYQKTISLDYQGKRITVEDYPCIVVITVDSECRYITDDNSRKILRGIMQFDDVNDRGALLIKWHDCGTLYTGKLHNVAIDEWYQALAFCTNNNANFILQGDRETQGRIKCYDLTDGLPQWLQLSADGRDITFNGKSYKVNYEVIA